MKAFEYFKVASVAQTLSLLTKHQEKAAILAGGSDLLGIMKDRLEGPKFKMPQYLIDIKGIKDLVYIKEQKTGLKIGATTTLTEIAASSLLRDKYPLLAQAAVQVGVPQIRNVGTLGGNLCQRPRCWYFRRSLFKDCLRKGGGSCYAPNGENQYHAIIGNSVCCMVYPSDMAPALTALNAKVEIAGPKGNRMVSMDQFYVRPEKNVLRENILTPQEMVVGVEVPNPPPHSKGIYIKMKERQAFDFAIASVAVSVSLKNNLVSDSRVVFGGMAPFPMRSIKTESVLKGKEIRECVTPACKAAVDGAQPLSRNGYKIDAVRGILEEALGQLA
ncbi:MAG: xanthine dehydrogenase family protein subunit M [Thermodesulfobacteriota bacterium]